MVQHFYAIEYPHKDIAPLAYKRHVVYIHRFSSKRDRDAFVTAESLNTRKALTASHTYVARARRYTQREQLTWPIAIIARNAVHVPPRPSFTYYVSTDTESYGPECTSEQASIIANYILDQLIDYAKQQDYDATIKLRSYVITFRGRPLNDEGEAALDDLVRYDEANWTRWAQEALA